MLSRYFFFCQRHHSVFSARSTFCTVNIETIEDCCPLGAGLVPYTRICEKLCHKSNLIWLSDLWPRNHINPVSVLKTRGCISHTASWWEYFHIRLFTAKRDTALTGGSWLHTCVTEKCQILSHLKTLRILFWKPWLTVVKITTSDCSCTCYGGAHSTVSHASGWTCVNVLCMPQHC